MAKTKLNSKKNPRSLSKYDDFKIFAGQYYKGMKVGGHHKWHYDPGIWKETKKTPDLWEIGYQVKKRRAGKAPEGSGVPVGTEYHWLIISHQIVHKRDANVYDTEMKGLKYKIAYKKAGQEKWSVSAKGKRKRMIGFLHQMLQYLEKEEIEEQRKKLLKKKQNYVQTSSRKAKTPVL